MPEITVKPVTVTMVQAFATHKGITFADAWDSFEMMILAKIGREILKDPQPKEVSKGTSFIKAQA